VEAQQSVSTDGRELSARRGVEAQQSVSTDGRDLSARKGVEVQHSASMISRGICAKKDVEVHQYARMVGRGIHAEPLNAEEELSSVSMEIGRSIAVNVTLGCVISPPALVWDTGMQAHGLCDVTCALATQRTPRQ
jgi:hypothetical protein